MGGFFGVKETKSQKVKETNSQRDKKTKSQKVKKSKRRKDRETKSQRDKGSKGQRVKGAKGRCAKVQRRLSYAKAKVKTYANLLHNDLLVADDIEAGGQSAEVRVSGGQDADGASEGVHHANCSFLLVSDGGANGRG